MPLTLNHDGTITSQNTNITSDGRMSLGSSSPASGVELHIVSGDYPYVRTTATGYTGIDFGQNSDNGEGLVKLRDSADLSFWTGDVKRASISSVGAFTTPYQPHWFGSNNNSYTTDSTTWITHGSGNNGGVNTGILKFPNVYSSSGSEWNGQRYTATVAGLYHWELTLDILNPAGIVFRGVKNGVRFHDEERVANISGGGWWNYNYSGYVYLNSGDYWEFQLTNGTWSNIAGGVWSKMAIRLVG